MNDYITIGEIVRAQGIKGEVKVRPLTDDPERFHRLKVVYIAAVPYRIADIRIDRFVYLKLTGVDDRNAAEALVGKSVDIDRVFAAPLEDEYTFYIADVEGCALYADGRRIGVIESVEQFGAADVFTVRCDDGRVLRFPYLKKLLVAFDADRKRFEVSAAELDRVSVYED